MTQPFSPVNRLRELPDNAHETLNAKGETPLYTAARCGDVEGCKRLLQLGASWHTKCGPNGYRPIHIAAANNHVGVIELYVGFIDPRTDDDEQLTPFALACKEGSVDAARLLLARGADPWAKCYGEYTFNPLKFAAMKNRAAIIPLFEGWKERFDEEKIFLIACRYDALEVACELLLLGVDPFLACECHGKNGLHTAAEHGCTLIVELLRHNPQLLNARALDGTTPLHQAALNGHLDAFRLLLEAGADLAILGGKAKETVVHIAAERDDADLLRCLKGYNIDLTTLDSADFTALDVACWSNSPRAASELVAMGAPLDRVCEFTQETALHTAARHGSDSVIFLFKDRPDIINRRDENGIVPLHLAAHFGHKGVVRRLLRYGASLYMLPRAMLGYSREIIDVFIEHQRKRAEALCERMSSEDCLSQIIDVLLDQIYISWFFPDILQLDDIPLTRLMRNPLELEGEEFARAFFRLPVHSKRDLSHLHNSALMEKLLGHIKTVQLERLNALTGPQVESHKKLISTLNASGIIKLYLSSKALVAEPKEVLDSLQALDRMIFEKYVSAVISFVHVGAQKESEQLASYPLTDAEFEDAPLFELLIRRYGLTKREVKQIDAVDAGLLEGRDLLLIGVDNGFYRARGPALKEAIEARHRALESWKNIFPARAVRITEVQNALDAMSTKLFEEASIEALEVSFGALTISLAPDRQDTLESLDRDSALILIELFVQERGEKIGRLLARSDCRSLSSYAARHPEKPFSPHDIAFL